MKISHCQQDVVTGHYLVGLAGPILVDCPVGSVLRCAGYRFKVESRVTASSEHLVLMVSGDDPPQVGMVVHLSSEPLTDEELTAAVQHLLMLPRMLKAIDAEGVLRRVAEISDKEAAEVRFAAVIVQNMATQVNQLVLPTDAALQVAERYKAELIKAC